MINAFLAQFAAELPADVHAAMVLDRAGRHTAAALAVPANVTLVHLPPESPELKCGRELVALPAEPPLVQPGLRHVGRPDDRRD